MLRCIILLQFLIWSCCQEFNIQGNVSNFQMYFHSWSVWKLEAAENFIGMVVKFTTWLSTKIILVWQCLLTVLCLLHGKSVMLLAASALYPRTELDFLELGAQVWMICAQLLLQELSIKQQLCSITLEDWSQKEPIFTGKF